MEKKKTNIIKNPNLFSDKFDIKLIKNPFQCRKCKQLPLMSYTYELPGELRCKCLCGFEWLSSVYNLVGYTHLENAIRELSKNKEKSKENDDLIEKYNNVCDEIITEWEKIIETNPKFLIEEFKINFNLRCKKHSVIANQYFCKTCMLPLCQKCRRTHLEHQIEEPELIDCKKIVDLLLKSINPFKKIIEKPMQKYNETKENLDQYIQMIKDSKKKKEGDKNLDYTKYQNAKDQLYRKSINQFITNKIIILFGKINIAVLEQSLPNPNFIVLHNAANTTEFNFTEPKELLEKIDLKTAINYSSRLGNYYSTNYLVGNYEESKTEFSRKKRIKDLPYNINSLTTINKFKDSDKSFSKYKYVLPLSEGKIAVCGSSEFITVFNREDREEIKIEGHKGGVNWLISSVHSELISCSDDCTIRKWIIERNALSRLFSSSKYYCEFVLEGHTKKVIKIDFDLSDKDKILSCSKDGFIKRWNIKDQKKPFVDIINKDKLISFIQLKPNFIVTASEDGLIIFWKLGNNSTKYILDEKHILKNIYCYSTGSLEKFGLNFLLVGESNSITVINYFSYQIYEKIEFPGLIHVSCFLNLNPASCIAGGFNKFWLIQLEELLFSIKKIETDIPQDDSNEYTCLKSLGDLNVCTSSIMNNIIKWKIS